MEELPDTPEEMTRVVGEKVYAITLQAYGVLCLSEDDHEQADEMADLVRRQGRLMNLTDEQISEDMERANIREVVQFHLHQNDRRNN